MQLNLKQISKIDKKIKITHEQTIVVVDVSDTKEGWTKTEINFNIYCIDKNYNIIWQVSEGKTRPAETHCDSFYYLGQNAQGEIIARRFSGFVYKIDPETGEAEQTGFQK